MFMLIADNYYVTDTHAVVEKNENVCTSRIEKLDRISQSYSYSQLNACKFSMLAA